MESGMDPVGCNDVRQRITSGSPLDAPEVAAHLRDCEPCSELAADGGWLGQGLGAVGEPELDVGALLDGTRAEVERESGALERLRSLPTSTRWLGLLVLIVVVSVGVLLGTPRADLAVFPLARMLLGLVALGAAALGALFVYFRPAYRPSLSGSWHLLVAFAVLVPIGLALLPPAHHAHPASLEGVGDDLVARAVACFLFGTGSAIPVAVASWLFARRGGLRRATVAAAMAAAAGIGNIALLLHCPLTAVVHRVAGHASVAVVFFLLSAGISVFLATRKK